MNQSRPSRPSTARLLTRSTRRRRERLSELERDVDPLVWDERRRAVRGLLARPLIVGGGETRVLVHRHQEWVGLWFSHQVGWELHVDADACRLVKRPADPDDDSRPCRDPANKDTALSRRGYVFLCLVLSTLVGEGRQLTLKTIADRLAGFGKADSCFEENGLPLELDRRETRRDLVHALRVLLDWGVLARVDGSEDGYVGSEETDVLYNVNRPILSRLLAARQPPSLVSADDHETRLHEIWRGMATAGDSDDWRTREIRYGLFRRLLDDPVLYYRDLDEAELAYLESQRTFILREITNATGLVAEVRAEGIAMVDSSGQLSDYSLPETGTDGHLTLLLATMLAERLRAGDERPVPVATLEAETRRLAGENPNWRKDARKPGSETALTRDALIRLRALGLLHMINDPDPAVVPLPAIGRFGLRAPRPEPAESQETLF
jgi:uncharacterized protein (TIGR02678 family)